MKPGLTHVIYLQPNYIRPVAPMLILYIMTQMPLIHSSELLLDSFPILNQDQHLGANIRVVP